MSRFRNLTGVIAAVAVVAVVIAVVIVVFNGSGTKTLVADFPRTIALYTGSDVKILGITVGKVDSVTPMGTKVEVKLSYDDKYKIPANAKAVVISPSIVGDRFVQLTPAYQGGASLPDGAHLGLDRTATPLELDQIFGSLNQLNIALGPKGANKPGPNGVGALTRLLDTTAKNFGGEGIRFNQTLQNLGKLTRTLAHNKNELFGSSAQVEKFVNALARNDKTVREFAQSLASGSQLLASDRHDLAAAVDNLAVAMRAVRGFVHDNRRELTSNIAGIRRISDTLVKRRDQLDETLTAGPLALNNLALTYDSNTGTEDTRDAVGQVLNEFQSNPLRTLCALLNIDGLSQNPKLCDGLGTPRPAALSSQHAARNRNADRFDPTLAGLVGGSR